MMDEDDDQSLHPVQILIDELKNDDLELRLNSMRSLSKIAEALGPERTRKELIPFLCLSAIDDEDEVLVVLAEQLGSFPDLVGHDFSYILVSPLEQLSSVEDENVRNQAVKSLSLVCNVLAPESVVEHVLPVAERLALGEWFTTRVSATILLPQLFSKVPSIFHEKIYTLFLALCNDDTPMVRREACIQLKNLAVDVNLDVLKKLIIPKFLDLTKDEQDSVRLLAVENALTIAKRLTEEDNVALVVGIVQNCADDKSWRVRYMVADIFCKLCEIFGSNVIARSLIPSFVKLLKDPEPEVRTVAAKNVVAVCSFVPKELAMKEVIPATKSLVTDSSQYVRISLAKVIMDLAPICGKENTTELLLELFMQLLKDECAEVRLSIISKLGAINDVLSVDLLEQSLLPAIVHLAEDKQWRVRLAIIDHIPLLAKQLGVQYFNDKLGPLCFSWLNDPVYSIREAATANLKKLSEIFGEDWTEKILIPKIVSLRSSPNYLYRMTALFSTQALVSSVKSNSLLNFMLSLVVELSEDSVPNIRFNVAKTLESIYPSLNGEGKQKTTLCLQKLQNDTDGDVRFYASFSLARLNAETQ